MNYFKYKKNQITLMVFIITVLIACAPLISKYCINGHDIEYHLLRIESLKEGILMGKPFLKVNVLFFGGAGYASSMFYPDFLLYIPALLRVIGISINTSYHIFAAICIILCYLSAYLCIRHMTGSTYGAMIAAVLLTLSPYHLADIYIRSAVGEYTAFIFIPVVIYSVYNIIYEDMDKPWLFVLGYAGVLLCHTSSFVMCTVFGMAALLTYCKRLFRNRKLLIRIIISTAVTLMLGAFYLMPMLEQFMNTSFYVSVPWMNPKDEALNFSDIFGSSFPTLGSICVLILIPRIFVSRPKTSEKVNTDTVIEETPDEAVVKELSDEETSVQRHSDMVTGLITYADILIAAGAMFTLMSCNIIPWERIGKYLSFIQFPWRFFIMGSVLFSMAAGLIYSRITGKDEDISEIWVFDKEADSTVINTGAVILTLILVISGISAFNGFGTGSLGYYDYSDDYYSYKPYTSNVIAGEWLPDTVVNRDSLIADSERMITSGGESIKYTRIKNTIVADIDGSCEYVDVPFIFYKGYKALFTDVSGTVTELAVSGDGYNGMCRVNTDGIGKGVLWVGYKGTTVTHISSFVSIMTMTVLIVFMIFKRKDHRKVGHE